MFVNTLPRRILFILFFSIFSLLFMMILFSPIYQSPSIYLSFTIHPIDIVKEYPSFWHHCKLFYLLFHVLANLIYSNYVYSLFFRKEKTLSPEKYIPSSKELSLFIGNTSNDTPIYLPESSLYQNILITGTIGTGKTSCAIYPFTQQLMQYQSNSPKNKLGMLILDVKGNYYQQVNTYAKQFQRQEDVIVIELRWLSKI